MRVLQNGARGMDRLAKTTPVFCKLSGLATEANPGWSTETLTPYMSHIIKSFGASRVMWGSDWPVLELNGSYPSWHEAALSSAEHPERDMIFGSTAAQFYRIK